MPTQTDYIHEYIDIQQEAARTAKAMSAAPFVSQQVIDAVLTSGGAVVTSGGAVEPSSFDIVAYFKKDHSTADNADFLRKEYANGGKGFVHDGNRISAWFDDAGLRITAGNPAHIADAALLTWEQAALRTRELLDLGLFMSQKDLDKVDGFELKGLAEKLWYLCCARTDDDIFSYMPPYMHWRNFPGETAQIAALLVQPNERKNILTELQEFAAEVKQNPDLLRFSTSEHNLYSLINTLTDLLHEPLSFVAAKPTAYPWVPTATVDQLLMQGDSDSKYRVYSYFMQKHSADEKVLFLQSLYGLGVSGRAEDRERHDRKGIVLHRGNALPYDKMTLPWATTVERIEKLIANGQYLSQEEIERGTVKQQTNIPMSEH